MKLKDFYSEVDLNSNIPAANPLEELAPNGGFCGIFRHIVLVGDSLSSGEMQSSPKLGTNRYHDLFEYSWGQYLGRLTGAEVKTCSRGGMNTQEYCESFADQYGYWNREYAAQAYIIALGHNDIGNQKVELGSAADIDPGDWKNNKKTFYGYYGQIIQRYKELEPHARFFLMTTPESVDGVEKQQRLEIHAKAVREIAGLFDYTYVLDFRKYAPCYDAAFRENFYNFNHMNPAGYLLTSRMVASYIDYLIRSDYKAFKQVGLIGTPYYDAEQDDWIQRH